MITKRFHEFGRHQTGISGLGLKMFQAGQEFVPAGVFEDQAGADAEWRAAGCGIISQQFFQQRGNSAEALEEASNTGVWSGLSRRLLASALAVLSRGCSAQRGFKVSGSITSTALRSRAGITDRQGLQVTVGSRDLETGAVG
ncbi:MAG: hypothetical protein ACRESZ_16065 [Methylococcales bacterium]